MTAPHLDDFITRWQNSAAAERANYALFLTQLCDLLQVPQPDPTRASVADNAYVFERDVTFDLGDGTKSIGRIDLYKRGCFVLEAKQGSDVTRGTEEAAQTLLAAGTKVSKKKGTAIRGTRAWDDAMIRARGQAEAYAKALPTSEGWPPFLIVVDVGHSIELYSEFTRSGKAYVQFPDPQSFRLKLEDLRDEKVRARLAAVWTDPLSLDPSRRAAKVTRELAERLAALAKLLEKAGHEAGAVAKFLMRCLFTMFAEDVDLIPKGSFSELLVSLQEVPENFQAVVEALWLTMNTGGVSPVLRKKILKFNGGLFAESTALPLDKPMLALLIEAAKSDWADVEPAIFGTLLERALDERERHKLGAHYTPRAYVERLVMPTVIEPLRDEWKTAYAAAITHAQVGEMNEAQAEVRAFHDRLCEVRVLDPACGSGNFLYVTLEHMKRLEGEVLLALREFGEKQQVLDIHEVDPHQFLGIELNPRAAAIADLVLWIGYLQWHFRTRGKAQPAEPIIRNYKNIECRDAVLAWDRTEPLLDNDGQPVTRWDGHTTKRHPVTGEEVPDDAARVVIVTYVNPQRAKWPIADFIVGNPPFVGNKRMRDFLGDGYSEAIRLAHCDVPSSVDFVLYWWNLAAKEVVNGNARRFGLITRNTIPQIFNRKVVQAFVGDDQPLHLVYAIPNHPWTDSADGAAVRIAMSVCARGTRRPGNLGTVIREEVLADGETEATLSMQEGIIDADFTIGSQMLSMVPLRSNKGLACPGIQLSGQGFVLSPAEKVQLEKTSSGSLLKRYLTGQNLMQVEREQYVIDTGMLSHDELLASYPDAFQWLSDRVRAQRSSKITKTKDSADYAAKWWRLSKPRNEFRKALEGVSQFLVSSRTSKHRIFQMRSREWLPETKILIVALADGWQQAVLSSRVHSVFAELRSGRHGVGDDPTYNHTECFDPFPFPAPSPEQQATMRKHAERLDRHRIDQKAKVPTLKLTDMYNVLEKLRSGEELSAKDKTIHDQGLVSVLRQIHDELDAAVFAAYDWPADLTDEQILERLVALNAERAAEEARGVVRWLRPEFQAPQAGGAKQAELELPDEEPAKPTKGGKKAAVPKAAKLAWPKERAQRTRAVQESLAAATTPLEPAEIAKQFTRGNAEQVAEILAALCSLGLARKARGRYTRA